MKWRTCFCLRLTSGPFCRSVFLAADHERYVEFFGRMFLRRAEVGALRRTGAGIDRIVPWLARVGFRERRDRLLRPLRVRGCGIGAEL